MTVYIWAAGGAILGLVVGVIVAPVAIDLYLFFKGEW